MKKTIDEVLTSAEVRSLWDVSEDEMANIIHRDGRVAFEPGKEIRNAKGAGEAKGRWLITRAGAERVFGFQKHGERNGEPLADVDLYSVLTRKEAVELWGTTLMKVRGAEQRQFRQGESRKSGRVSLITKKAMTRVFGEQVHPQVNHEIVTADMLVEGTTETQDVQQRMATLFAAAKTQPRGVTWMSVVALLTPFAAGFSRRRNKHEADRKVIEDAAKIITAIFEETIAASGDFAAATAKMRGLK